MKKIRTLVWNLLVYGLLVMGYFIGAFDFVNVALTILFSLFALVYLITLFANKEKVMDNGKSINDIILEMDNLSIFDFIYLGLVAIPYILDYKVITILIFFIDMVTIYLKIEKKVLQKKNSNQD